MDGVVARIQHRRPGQLGPGIADQTGTGTLLTDPVLEPAELGQGDLVVRVGGQHRLVELGGQTELAAVLGRGSLVEGPGQLLTRTQAHRAGGRLTGKPGGGEDGDGDDERHDEAPHRARQEPPVPAATGPGGVHVGHGRTLVHRHRFGLVEQDGAGRRHAGGVRDGVRDRRRRRRHHRNGRAWPVTDRPECGQAAEVALAQCQIVAVGQVSGQVLGIGIGQGLGQKTSTFLEDGRIRPGPAHVGIEVPVAPVPSPHQDGHQDHGRTHSGDQRQDPHQDRPPTGRGVEDDGRAVAGDQVVLDLLVTLALIDQVGDRGPHGDRRRRAGHGHGQVLATRAPDDRLDGCGPLGSGRRGRREHATARQQGDDQDHGQQRPHREVATTHAPLALARAINESRSAAVTGATM